MLSFPLPTSAEAAAEEGAGPDARLRTSRVTAGQRMRFQELDDIRPMQLTDGFLGVPLKQQLRENLTLGVTENGINWRFDW